MPETTNTAFREALRKLGSDAAYREKMIANPKSILGDFKLQKQDISALYDAARLSGVDLTEINKLMEYKGIAKYAADAPMLMDNGCCCCCCCCGETGADILVSIAK